jgi:hypothetical protein
MMRHGRDRRARITPISGWGCLVLFLAFFTAACARAPEVETKPEPAPPPPPPKFAMQPYHHAMSEEMKTSYSRADEVLVGMIEGVVRDKTSGTVCYVSDFRRFDKDMMAWEPEQNTVMQVLPENLRLDIIRHGEFKRLIDLDKVGICWDIENGRRNIYLVEGQENLIFIEFVFDEAGQTLTRRLIDIYPATRECRAADVFVLAVREIAMSRKSETP